MYGRPQNSAYQSYSPHPQQLQAGYSAQQPQYPGQPPPQQYGQAYNRPPPPPPPSGYQQQQQYPSGQQYNYQTPPYSPPGQGYNYQQPYPPASPNPAYGYGQGGPPGGAPQGQYPGQQPGYPGGAPGGAPGRQYQPQGGYKQHILQFIQANGLGQIYPPNHPLIDQLASTAPSKIDAFCQRWRVSPEIGIDILGIALYDIILYIDDSGSMQFEQNGSRIDDLRAMLERIAYAATLFDDDGISIRFMNSVPPPQYTDHIRNDQQITQLMSNMQFRGLTPMGTELRKKVVDPFIVSKARSGQLRKPVLVITVTDGQPGGEPQNALEQTLDYCFGELNRTPLGAKGAAFQFVQVGDDAKAREFLGKLDENKRWGHSVDCTSDYENEEQEFMRQGQTLTPEYYMLKLLCGAIDRSYDKKDEQAGAGGNYGGPPGGGYGAPPQQGGYGGAPPPGQYGGPPPGQYGGPPQGQYGAPPPGQYGAPPPGQGGYPGQQQGYPPQGGGFGQNPRY